MTKKLKVFLFGVSLLICACFFRPIAFHAVGLSLKLFVRFQYQSHLTFRSIDYREGALLLSDVVCVDATGETNSFYLHIPSLRASLFPIDLKLERPRLTLLTESPPISFDGALSIVDGQIDWPNAPKIEFCLDWRFQEGWVEAKCLGGTLSLELSPDHLQLDCKQWPLKAVSQIAAFYQLPVPDVKAGTLNGVLETQGSSKKIGSHLNLEGVCLSVQECELNEMEGTVSYHSDLGAKWDLAAIGSWGEAPTPLTLKGKTYWNSELANWLNADLAIGPDWQIAIEGQDVENGQFLNIRSLKNGQLQAAFEVEGSVFEWAGTASVLGAPFTVQGGLSHGGIYAQAIWPCADFLSVEASKLFWKDGKLEFDVRLCSPTWDLARCKGFYQEAQLQLDPKSHFLGEKIHWDGSVLESRLPLRSIAAMSAIWPKLQGFADLPLEGNLSWQFCQNQLAISSSELVWKGRPVPPVTAAFEWTGQSQAALQIAGAVLGQGHLTWREELEVDLDLMPIQLEGIQTQGLTHLFYSPKKGGIVQGLDLCLPICCKADVFRFDPITTHWNLSEARIHIDKKFDGNIHFAHWNGQRLKAKIQDGLVQIEDKSIHIEDAELNWDQKVGFGHFHIAHRGSRFQIGFQASEQSGFCTISEKPNDHPLRIDWDYDLEKGLGLRSIEGFLSGIEASFRATEPFGPLWGSARIDFQGLARLVPPIVAKTFTNLEMGKGYVFKGMLTNRAELNGIVIGKDVELFGFEFQTFFTNIDFSLRKVHLWDVKVSDRAGTLVIDQLLSEEPSPDTLWTLEIPHASLIEFRPSLLRSPGEKESGPLNPLVVRYLHLEGLSGIAADSKTYKGQGDLFFINTFRRQFSLIDLPADVLSRIVGIDLELLIPVEGKVTYHLEDGFARLDSLENAFSEGHRSEFFLVQEAGPCMDLEGNLNILIKMKQYVLFKLTESFQISIDGQLKKPKYHLQKRRRFLGL